MMAGEFCFTQTDDGKIVEVSYPDGESSEAVNFKKGIVAAFQTNFKGTAEQEEEDTTSLHKSAYRCVCTVYIHMCGYYPLSRYATRGTEITAYRTVQSSNVHVLAGGTPTEDVQITANEQIIYDGKVLTRSQGSTSVVLTAGLGDLDSSRVAAPAARINPTGVLAKLPEYEQEVLGRAKRQVFGRGPVGLPLEQPATYDSNTDINDMKGEGEYTLVKIFCRAAVARTTREAWEEDDGQTLVTDTLRANINYSQCTYTIST